MLLGETISTLQYFEIISVFRQQWRWCGKSSRSFRSGSSGRYLSQSHGQPGMTPRAVGSGVNLGTLCVVIILNFVYCLCMIMCGCSVMVHMWRSEDTGVGSHLLPFKFRPSGLCGRNFLPELPLH